MQYLFTCRAPLLVATPRSRGAETQVARCRAAEPGGDRSEGHERPVGQRQGALSDWDRRRATIAELGTEVDRLLALAGIDDPCRVLDLACGTGAHLCELACRGHDCIGIDRLIWKLFGAAAADPRSGLRLVCGDLRRPPICDCFDLVLCLYAMSSFRDPDDLRLALVTARRLLAPGGRFVFNVLHREANRDPRSPTHDLVYRDGYLRDFDRDEVSAALAAAGLAVRRQQAVDHSGLRGFDLFTCAVRDGDRCGA